MSRRPVFPLGLALGLGLGSGALEVALRAAPRLGLSARDGAVWLVASVGLSSIYLLAVAGLAWGARRWPRGALVGALVFVHAALAWRFGVVVNAYLHEPRVWAVILGIFAVSVGISAGLDRWIAAHVNAVAWGGALLGLVSGGVAFARLAQPPPRASPAPAERPNVVLVTLDTARADRFSAYGSTNPTPALDALAQQGVLFEQAIATAPLTEPSHLAILTGIPPHQSGVVANGTDLGPRPALLSVALQARGWATAAFVAGFPLSGGFGWGEGFDVYDDDFGATPGLHRLSLLRAWDQVVLPAHALRERPGDRVLARALPWMDAHAKSPFFLWIHLFDAHGPYDAPGQVFDPPTDGAPLSLPPYWPPRYRAITSEAWLVRAYEAEIRTIDALLGQVADHLDGLGLGDRTLLVVTADHGESLTEHGYLFDHGDDLYDPSLRVPLLMRFPGHAVAGTRVPCEVSNADVTPTVLDLLGIDDGLSRGGLSRAADLGAASCTPSSVVSTTVGARYTDAPPVDHALRGGGHKLISWAARPDAPARSALYDLTLDPDEERPLDAPDLSARYGALLDGALQTGTAAASARQDPGTVEALRALGYVE